MKKTAAALALGAFALAARADEGMWTFNGFPRQKVETAYGVKLTDAWLDHVRLSSARLAQGCSGSFVSPNGLVMTNHHCVEACLEQLSTAARDYKATGFYAKTAADEVKCPVLEVNQLVEITDVTERLRKATAGLEGQAFQDARKAETGKIEAECQSTPALRCSVVTLYHGGVYDLYKYRRYQDVRVVFAPEFAIAFFGGDPDNFMFPRYDLDVSFVRVYEDGKPLRAKDHFRWNRAGPKAGEVVFVSGNPGGTSRQLTVAQLQEERDVTLPERIARLSELRGALTEFRNRGPEQKRVSEGLLFGVENSLKAFKGRREALVDRDFFAQKVAAEDAFKKLLGSDPKNGPAALRAFASIQDAENLYRNVRFEVSYVAGSAGFLTDYFQIARMLVRGAEERAKPNAVRLEEFQEAQLPALTQRLFSPAPIYNDFEVFKFAWSLTKLREELGPDHPFVKKVLGASSPSEVAERLVSGTKLKDVALRKKLWEGGKAAVDASDDPMIAFARLVDPDSRAVRKMYENDIDSVVRKGSEAIAQARFAVEGTANYPDATFSPRLSYGAVKGWKEGRKEIAPFTTLAGAFERNTGRDPFALPKSWIDAKPRLDLATPFDFAATTDIIGGNSGSPVVDANGDVVGLVFDGNIWSLGGDYGFDPALNRTVAVDTAAITEALGKIYGATRVLDELLPTK
ncbi:MAG TPA: S46 family peptidase [Anaeromyxobacteraceae bacterium]|nr:S46 family peptidase [Anaeromyxobacteraceae bacterium]